ncbi:MAG: hypothetical protein ACRDOE_03750, partial [Streptosporangiaceae bacterium]
MTASQPASTAPEPANRPRERKRQLRAFAGRAARSIRICQLPEPGRLRAADDAGRAAIPGALISRGGPGALTGMAHH